MDFILHPWQLYFLILAGWGNRQQQIVIDYLRTENQVLTEKLGKKRILLIDDQQRRLAVKGKFLAEDARTGLARTHDATAGLPAIDCQFENDHRDAGAASFLEASTPQLPFVRGGVVDSFQTWPTPCAALAANRFPAREKATGLLPRITRSRLPVETSQIEVS